MTENILDSHAMAEKIKAYIQGRRDDKEEKLLKDKPNKKGKGGINIRLISAIKSSNYYGASKEKLDSLMKAKKGKDESGLNFEQSKYQKLVQLTAGMSQNIIDDYHAELGVINEEHDIATWMNWAAEKAEGISLATHVVKLTNSSISKASNVYDKTESTNLRYLTTSSIHKPHIDGAYNNAADAPITSLLKLEQDGVTLADFIAQQNSDPFSEFSNDSEQMQSWVNGLKNAMEAVNKSSHYLAKQIYHPVSKTDYHLLLPVISSSVAQLIFERLKRYSYDTQKKEIDKRNKKLYSADTIVNFNKKSVIKVTASNHQNVSSLNGKRGGRLSLFSCSPPLWRVNPKPPLKLKNLFYGQLRYSSRKDILVLQNFLLLLKKQRLNSKDPKLHAHLISLLDSIIESVFGFVSSMQNLSEMTGWTAQSKLKLSHQLLLDPFREEESFQQQRIQKDWQSEISSDFAVWLNKQLEHKRLTLSLAQESFWKKIMQQRLREFLAFREMER